MNTSEIIVPFAEGPEKSVLSSILNDERMLARARAEGITEEHFHMPGRKALFCAMLDRDSRGLSNELVGLVNALHAAGELDDIGGPSAITEIYTYAPNSQHFGAHVKILRENLARRRAQLAALEILESGGDMDPVDLTKALRDATDATTSALEHDSGVLTAKQAVAKFLEQMQRDSDAGQMPGISSGLDAVDVVTGGMRPGELWVVAAEPSGGKSVVMLQATMATLQAGKRVLVISLEMDAGVVISRLTSCYRMIPLQTFTHPKQAGARWLMAGRNALQELAEMPLSIHDRGGLSFDQIAGIARCEADRHGGIDLLVVDYIQLAEGNRKRNESREQEVASVSRGLKALAKELRCPVFSASQLNDQGRMRESRAIGQDADVVLVIQSDGILGLKVRNGQRDQLFPLKLNGAIQRFERFEPPQNNNQR